MKDAIKKMVAQFSVMNEKIKSLTEVVNWYKDKVAKLVQEMFEKDKQIEILQEKADDLERVKRYTGTDKINKIIKSERQREGFSRIDNKQVNTDKKVGFL